MDAVIMFIEKFVGMIPGQEWSMLALIGIAVEFIFRLFKTTKPLSIAWLVVGIVKKVSYVVGLVATGLEKIAALLDKVLPQKTV